jgi:hypothetical protein
MPPSAGTFHRSVMMPSLGIPASYGLWDIMEKFFASNSAGVSYSVGAFCFEICDKGTSPISDIGRNELNRMLASWLKFGRQAGLEETVDMLDRLEKQFSSPNLKCEAVHHALQHAFDLMRNEMRKRTFFAL